ncbi:hypothetical protein B0H13DRAFT_2497808 [Mycena leptocephala]|nr:hypothetical protein B0H13DRAFT_2497808 [Mycena leptocephala]
MGLDISEALDSPDEGISLFSLSRSLLWLPFVWLLRCRLIFVFALSELFFSVYHYHLVTLVSVPWKHGTGNIAQLQIAFTRVLKSGLASLPEHGFDEESLDADRPGSPAESITQLEPTDPRGIDFRNVLRTWFGRVPWSSIRRLEVAQWLYWSIFNKDLPEPHNVPPSHQAILDETLELLEKRLGTCIPAGSNPDASPMRMTLDKVHVYGRPFFYYALISGVNWYLRTWYGKYWNMRHGNYKGLEYLVYVPENWDRVAGPSPTGPPLQFPDRPLLIPLQPHVSQDIFHPHFLDPLCRQDLADRLAGLMHELGWVDLPSKDSDDLGKEDVAVSSSGVTVLSHSKCLLQLSLPASHHRFRVGGQLLVGTELGVANLLRRQFDWSSNALWYEEIPNARDPSKTIFLLGGQDDIINAKRVEKYLTSHGVRKGLFYDPDACTGRL